MQVANILRSTEIKRTPRVLQLEGMFDVPPTAKSEQSWDVSLDLPEEWNVGLIVGPSGAGKSTVAKQLFGEHLVNGFNWPHDASIVDGFPEGLGIKEIVMLLSSVGFSSPPTWLRPFHVLSNGEQFRATMARALSETKEGICVVDEFTSVVDRTVAKIGSSAIAKTVRRRKQKFIAVTCHYDVAEWLEPDWIYEPHIGRFQLARGCLQRPKIELEIRRVHHTAWKLFKPHHYLTSALSHSAFCFVAFWENNPVAFDAWLPFVGRLKGNTKAMRGHRTVCLPDYQGIGIGNALFTQIARAFSGLGYRCFSGTGHPAEIAKRLKSNDWRMTHAPRRTAVDSSRHCRKAHKHSTDRLMASFEFCGAPLSKADATKVIYG